MSPSALMELFSTRPEFGRPLTWRHHLEAGPSIPIQDYTKTPIPRVSSRIMGRQREGLLLRRVERALRDDSSAFERSSALNVLITRTWSKGFFLALYPTLLDPLLKYTHSLLSDVDTAVFANPLLNSPAGEQDSKLSHLLRISVIFRNISQSSHNVVLMASHQGVLSVMTQLIALSVEIDFIAQSSSSRYSLSHLQGLSEALASETCVLTREGSEHVHSRDRSCIDPVSVIQSLKTNSCESQLNDMQMNGLEVLCKLVSVVKLAPDREAPSSISLDSNFQDIDLSSHGLELLGVMPVLVELVTSESTKSNVLFIAVETLARLLLNSNSRPLWQSLPLASRTEFMETMLHYAVRDDELSDWALFAAFHFSLNAFDLAVVHSLTNTSAFVDVLVHLAASYATVPTSCPPEYTQAVAHRRYSFALRSAVILHRLVEFVSIKHLLLPYEDVIASMYLDAPVPISDALFVVFLEMQS